LGRAKCKFHLANFSKSTEVVLMIWSSGCPPVISDKMRKVRVDAVHGAQFLSGDPLLLGFEWLAPSTENR
jgi:hypothetical protein